MSTPAAENPAPLETRVDRLENSQDLITRKLDQVLGALGGKKVSPANDLEGTETEPGGRPGSVAEQVRAELARAEQEKAKQQADESSKTERESMAERLAKLEEKKPEAPQPRRQKIMWGGR